MHATDDAIEPTDATDDTLPAALAEHGYTVLERLGHTAEAGRTTWLARDADGTRVVVKHFAFAAPSTGWDGYSTLEIEALRAIRHPRVPRYLDHYRTGERGFCLVQTFLEAPGIDTTRPWSLAEAVALAEQVLEILVHLEEKVVPPVIHGDVSPGNLRRDADGRVHLVDFVLTRERRGELASRSRLAGTPGFVAPERVRGARGDVRSDLFGLGTTLVALLRGVGAGDPQQLRDAQDALAAELVERNAPFDRWLRRMTASDPNARFNHARLALKALRAVELRLEPAQPPGAPAPAADDETPRNVRVERIEAERTERVEVEIDPTAPGGDFVRAMLLLVAAMTALIMLAIWLG